MHLTPIFFHAALRDFNCSDRQIELDRIKQSLALDLHVGETGLLVSALSIEHLQHADIALLITVASEIDLLLGSVLRVGARYLLVCVVMQRLERIGHLLERLEHNLLVVGR